MNDPDTMAAAGGEEWGLWQVLQSTALAILAGSICTFPRAVPWILVVVTLLHLLPQLDNARSLLRQAVAGLAPVATLALPALGIVSTLWSGSRQDSFSTASTALLLGLCTLILLASVCPQMERMSPDWRRRFVRAIPIGGLAGLSYLLIEVTTGNAIARRALSAMPVLTGERGKGVRVDAGQISEVAGFFINRNVAGLTLLAIPMLLAAWLWLTGARRSAVLSLAILCLFVVVFRSESETAKLALIAGVSTVVVATRWPRPAMYVLAGALALGLLFTLTLVRIPILLKLHEAGWMPHSHRDRVLIWDYNAEVAGRHPVFGAGVEASRVMQQEVIKERKQAERVDAAAAGNAMVGTQATVTRRPAWHAHNFYLQARLELGIVGSLAALVFGLAMIAATTRLHPRLVPWGLGMIAATMASAISGWGLWQYWFLAGLGADVVFLGLINAEMRCRDRATA